MTSIVKNFAFLLIVVSTTLLAGCANLPSSTGGSDTAMVGDLLTERAIIRAIYDEPELTGQNILVGCVDGVVTLSGTVDTQLDVQLAGRIAEGMDGVKSVNNSLQTRS